jgi:hypothetical protein
MSFASVAVTLALAGLAACSSSLVSPGIQPIDGAYAVETPIGWRRHVESEKVEIWTSRDPTQDQLIFVTGLAPGEALLPEFGEFPRYEAGMTPDMIARFILNSYVLQYGHPTASVHRTWPHRLGSVQGFRFEYGYTTKFDIQVHGFGTGAVKGGKLYLICLEAAGEQRFRELRPTAEQIMASATL